MEIAVRTRKAAVVELQTIVKKWDEGTPIPVTDLHPMDDGGWWGYEYYEDPEDPKFVIEYYSDQLKKGVRALRRALIAEECALAAVGVNSHLYDAIDSEIAYAERVRKTVLSIDYAYMAVNWIEDHVGRLDVVWSEQAHKRGEFSLEVQRSVICTLLGAERFSVQLPSELWVQHIFPCWHPERDMGRFLQ
jgi:hypothetical protein